MDAKATRKILAGVLAAAILFGTVFPGEAKALRYVTEAEMVAEYWQYHRQYEAMAAQIVNLRMQVADPSTVFVLNGNAGRWECRAKEELRRTGYANLRDVRAFQTWWNQVLYYHGLRVQQINTQVLPALGAQQQELNRRMMNICQVVGRPLGLEDPPAPTPRPNPRPQPQPVPGAVWVLNGEKPFVNPQNVKPRQMYGSEWPYRNFMLTEEEWTERNVTSHVRHERNGQVTKDWQFYFTIDGTVPQRLAPGQQFSLTITATATGEKMVEALEAALRVEAEGFHVACVRGARAGEDSLEQRTVQVGRNWTTGEMVARASKSFTFTVQRERIGRLELEIRGGLRGIMIRYEWEK